LERARVRGDDATDSQTLLLKAGQHLFDTDVGGYLEGRAILESLLAREPENFSALAMKAHSHLHEAFCGYRRVAEDDTKAAFAAASRAVQLNENSDFARVVLGSVYVFAMADPAAARRETERALELNPYYSFAMHALGGILMCQGAMDDGLAQCRRLWNRARAHPIRIGCCAISPSATSPPGATPRLWNMPNRPNSAARASPVPWRCWRRQRR